MSNISNIIYVIPKTIKVSGVLEKIEQHSIYSKEYKIFIWVDHKKIFINHSRDITAEYLKSLVGKPVSILCSRAMSLSVREEYYIGDKKTLIVKEG